MGETIAPASAASIRYDAIPCDAMIAHIQAASLRGYTANPGAQDAHLQQEVLRCGQEHAPGVRRRGDVRKVPADDVLGALDLLQVVHHEEGRILDSLRHRRGAARTRQVSGVSTRAVAGQHIVYTDRCHWRKVYGHNERHLALSLTDAAALALWVRRQSAWVRLRLSPLRAAADLLLMTGLRRPASGGKRRASPAYCPTRRPAGGGRRMVGFRELQNVAPALRGDGRS